MIRCTIIRTNRTLKVKRINEKKDGFNFEGGKYYIKPEHVLLEKRLIGWKPKLLYIENISEPISFENVRVSHKSKDDTTILIDAKSIHNLTSRELLDVLTRKKLTGVQLALILMVLLTLILSVANLVK